MADIRPVWLLDIDGVINACTRTPDPSIWPKDQWETGKATGGGREWPILWSRPVVDFIRRIHDTGQAEIRWHTTWQHDAQALADRVGLPTFAVAEAPEYNHPAQHAALSIGAGMPTWWKLPAAERLVRQEKRPLIWTDDDITWSLHRYNTDKGLRVFAPALLVSPDARTGLTPKHLRKIGAFLAALATDAGRTDAQNEVTP